MDGTPPKLFRNDSSSTSKDIWNSKAQQKASRSTVASDTVQEVVIVPTPGEDNCFFGTLLQTIIKKVVALQPDLSSMTYGLARTIEDANRYHFENVFQNDGCHFSSNNIAKVQT